MRAFKSLIIIGFPLVVGWISLFLGAYDISPLEVIKILFFAEEDETQRAIVWEVRLPRVLLAGLTGASLSCAGVVLQSLFRNPLVDSYILGISAGAAFGCAISVVFFPSVPVQIMAFICGLFAVFLAYTIAQVHDEVSRLALILAGIIVSALFSALLSVVKFLADPHRLQNIVYWLMGSFSLADWKAIKVGSGLFLLSILPIFFMRWRLNVLSLSEVEAQTLGINVKRERLIFISLATLAVVGVTSLSGIIGWVGLIIPHMIRLLIGPDHRTLVPLSIFGGAGFMITADTISRNLVSFDIPIGIITALIGAPFFMFLLKKEGYKSWGR